MMFRTIGWVAVLLMAGLVALAGAALAFMAGAAWAVGLIAVIWGVFLLALTVRWTPLRDLAWAAGAGYAVGVMRWLDVPGEASSGLRWMVLGADALCLFFFALIAPALLARVAAVWMPKPLPPEPGLPLEQPASAERLRQWDPRK